MSFRKIKNERKLCVILCTPARCVVMCVMVYFELQLANREKKEGTSRRRGLNFRGKFMPPLFPSTYVSVRIGSTYNKSRGERRKDSCTILCVKKCLYVVGTHVRIGGLGYIPTTSPGGRPGAKNTSHSLEIYGLTHSNVFLLPSSDLSCVLVRKW